jgi:hypothetical protein
VCACSRALLCSWGPMHVHCARSSAGALGRPQPLRRSIRLSSHWIYLHPLQLRWPGALGARPLQWLPSLVVQPACMPALTSATCRCGTTQTMWWTACASSSGILTVTPGDSAQFWVNTCATPWLSLSVSVSAPLTVSVRVWSASRRPRGSQGTVPRCRAASECWCGAGGAAAAGRAGMRGRAGPRHHGQAQATGAHGCFPGRPARDLPRHRFGRCSRMPSTNTLHQSLCRTCHNCSSAS